MTSNVSTLSRRRPGQDAVQAETIDTRPGFVRRVADALDLAGVEHVVLHGAAAGGVDSDLDVAVDRDGLAVVDSLARAGAFGRLLQSLHYDIPWCRWYVFETGDPRRPYRQLDVACDPWGIGRYGPSIPLALARAARSPEDGLHVPDSAAEVVYLAVKRARKGLVREHDARDLRRAFAQSPEEARALLAQTFGESGARVADALNGNGHGELSASLDQLGRTLARQRARPVAAVRRGLLSASRIWRRLAHPSGLVVWVVGPDGAGKSTLANALEGAADGAFRRYVRLHLGPSVLGPPGRLLRRGPADSEDPHSRRPSGAMGSFARLVYLWLDAVVAWLPQITLPRLRSALVVVERGWADLEVDPRRYRIGLPSKVIAFFGALLPEPDLVLVLSAPSSLIRERKPELELSEIDRQLAAWQARLVADPERFVAVDVSAGVDDTLAEASQAIRERLASRQHSLAPYAFALRCLGRQGVGGDRFELLGERWVLPHRAGSPGPLGAGLYRPARIRHRVGALAVERLRRVGGARQFVDIDVRTGVGPSIADALGVDRIELAAALTGGAGRSDRVLVSAIAGGRPIAFAKVAAADEADRLHHEQRVLEALAAWPLRILRVPEVVTLLDWQGYCALLLRPVETGGLADRELGAVETAGLVELARLRSALAPVLGRHDGLIPVHGDFAPWNCSRAGGRLTLWDWEAARLGLPLEDLFHWRIQRLALFGEGSAQGLVDGAVEPDELVRRLAGELGVPAEAASAGLRSALEHGIRPAWTTEQRHAVRVRQQALELLARRLA